MPRKPKPVSIAEQAQQALVEAKKRGETLSHNLFVIADCMKQLHEGYQEEQVTPTGDVVVVTKFDFKAAAAIGKDLSRLYQELAVLSENVQEEGDTEVRFIQQPVIIPVDTRVARAEREQMELDYIEVSNG